MHFYHHLGRHKAVFGCISIIIWAATRRYSDKFLSSFGPPQGGIRIHFGRHMRKRVFRYMRTVKVQIRLCMRAVWSGPSLSANKAIRYYRMYEWTAKARLIFCASAGWSESAHVAHVWSHSFTWYGPFYCSDFEGWSQDCSKSDGCFSKYLISSPWRRYEDYLISFCKQWKFRCHCSYAMAPKFTLFTKGSKMPLNKGFKNMFELLQSCAQPTIWCCFVIE